MTVSRLDRMTAVDPAWEPTPWYALNATAEEMFEGFKARAALEIEWVEVPLLNFPAQGIFGHGREWFIEHDVGYYATHNGEDLVLVDHVWFGWPDPPRWQLASRPLGSNDPWQSWGCFPELPSSWMGPDQKKQDAKD